MLGCGNVARCECLTVDFGDEETVAEVSAIFARGGFLRFAMTMAAWLSMLIYRRLFISWSKERLKGKNGFDGGRGGGGCTIMRGLPQPFKVTVGVRDSNILALPEEGEWVNCFFLRQ